ncbi:MAG: PspC domain-containing protein [Actinobacteria bacterium]|nr:PspC domain-containing protein [Actinomycetota bacterium]
MRTVPDETLTLLGVHRGFPLLWSALVLCDDPRRSLQRCTIKDHRFGLAVRRSEDRLVTGLAGGIAETLGIASVFVRAAFVVLAFAGGVGVLLYLIGWVLTLETPDATAVEALRKRVVARTGRQRFALAVMFLGILLLLRSMGLWFGDSLVWPVSLIVFGFALTWSRLDEARRTRWARRTFSAEDLKGTLARLAVGGLLMTVGLGLYLRSIDAVALVGGVVLAVLMTAVGLGLILGPWVWRLITQLTTERRERIRSDERAEVAAHLHDSVLQTLALIQRTDDVHAMVMLARRQERELRAWLYDGSGPEGGTLRAALEQAAARLEEVHQVPVDVVAVGDAPLDDKLRAVVAAAGEAMTNAAHHSGCGHVSVFAEVSDATIDVYVTDQGTGFDLEAVPDGRRGIAESIIGRMQRQGGEAAIASEKGVGTEVHLKVGRS